MIAARTTDAAGASVRLTGHALAPDPAHTDTADLLAGVWLTRTANLHAGNVAVRLHASTADPALTDVEVLTAMQGRVAHRGQVGGGGRALAARGRP